MFEICLGTKHLSYVPSISPEDALRAEAEHCNLNPDETIEDAKKSDGGIYILPDALEPIDSSNNFKPDKKVEILAALGAFNKYSRNMHASLIQCYTGKNFYELYANEKEEYERNNPKQLNAIFNSKFELRKSSMLQLPLPLE
jgi:hypothetical protein